MNNMRRGFTMIELIFVIVIIGILAAVAIPKLSATRDDAKVSACVQDFSILLKDLNGYYTSQGSFDSVVTPGTVVMSEISNVEVAQSGLTANGSAGTISMACNDPVTPTAAVTLVFSRVTDTAGNARIQVASTATSVTQGTVDGDFGFLLKAKNLADTTAVNHFIGGMRVKR